MLRGADGEPHQVRLEGARGRGGRAAGRNAIGARAGRSSTWRRRSTRSCPSSSRRSTCSAGWYRLECDVVIDGDRGASSRPGERFAMPWPRAPVRRGLDADRQDGRGRSALGDARVRGRQRAHRLRGRRRRRSTWRSTVDGRTHPVLEVEHDDERGERPDHRLPGAADAGAARDRDQGASRPSRSRCPEAAVTVSTRRYGPAMWSRALEVLFPRRCAGCGRGPWPFCRAVP